MKIAIGRWRLLLVKFEWSHGHPIFKFAFRVSRSPFFARTVNYSVMGLGLMATGFVMAGDSEPFTFYVARGDW